MKPHPRGPRTAAHTLVLAAAATLLIASCGSDEQSDSTSAAQAGPSIEVSAIWARTSPAVAGAAAVYMTIDNTGGVEDALIAVLTSTRDLRGGQLFSVRAYAGGLRDLSGSLVDVLSGAGHHAAWPWTADPAAVAAVIVALGALAYCAVRGPRLPVWLMGSVILTLPLFIQEYNFPLSARYSALFVPAIYLAVGAAVADVWRWLGDAPLGRRRAGQGAMAVAVAGATLFGFLASGYLAAHVYAAQIGDRYVADTQFVRRVRSMVPVERLFINAEMGQMETFHCQFYLAPGTRVLHNLSFLRSSDVPRDELYLITYASDADKAGADAVEKAGQTPDTADKA